MAVAGNNSATHWASSCCTGIDTILFELDGLLVSYALWVGKCSLATAGEDHCSYSKNCDVLTKTTCAIGRHRLACVCLGNSSTMDYPGESCIGLGHLLHSSPKPSTCVTQLRRANIPSTLSAIQSMALQPQETSNQPLQSG